MIDRALLDGLPLLAMLLVLPVGAALIWMVPGAARARWMALGASLANLGLSLWALVRFEPSDGGFQMVSRLPWIPTLNVDLALGVDGISIGFLPLATMLFLGVVLATWNGRRQMPRLYYSLLLMLETTVLAVFCALDAIAFFLFWELSLIPLFFLISLWGVGPNRRFAATKYTLLMLIGGVPLLFGFLLLAFNRADVSGVGVPAGLAFDLQTLLATPLPHGLEVAVLFLLLIGFAVKTPVFPVHTWMPTVAAEGPVGVLAIVAGLKLGAYGILRFAIPLAPEAAQRFHWLLAGLGVVGVLYGSLAALAQTNLRRMLAFSGIAHVGLVLIGIASFSLQGLQGALLQLFNFAAMSGGAFLLLVFLHQRTGTCEIAGLGGVARTMPRLAGFFLLLGLASMGLPGTAGFPAELLLILSAFETHRGAGLAALVGTVLGAAYFLSAYRRAFLGPATQPAIRDGEDLRPRELAIALLLAAAVLIPGIYPQPFLDLSESAAQAWLARLRPAVDPR